MRKERFFLLVLKLVEYGFGVVVIILLFYGENLFVYEVNIEESIVKK